MSTVDDKNNGPLHEACSLDAGRVVQQLLAYGAEVDAMNGDGWTPLMVSASVGAVDSATKLLQQMADVNAVSPTLQNSLHLAAARGHTAVIAYYDNGLMYC